MRRFLATLTTVAALACPGCGDPEKSRMAVGSRAMVVSHWKEDHGAYVSGLEGLPYAKADDGTQVVVVADDEPGVDAGGRDVRVRIADGSLRDRVGMINRWSLKPE